MVSNTHPVYPSFVEDSEIVASLKRSAWKNTKDLRRGMWTAVIVLLAALPLTCMLGLSISYPMNVLGMAIVFLPLVLSIILFLAIKFSSQFKNGTLGRTNQEIIIADGWMYYSYFIANMHWRDPNPSAGAYHAIIDLKSALQTTYNPNLRLITLMGSIWFYKDPYKGAKPPALHEMERPSQIEIPNCFTPDLYQAISRFNRIA